MKGYWCFVLLLVAFASCKRDDNPQPYSSWTIGTDSFSTNQVDLHYGDKGQNASLGVYANGSRFAYSNSASGSLPNNGSKSFDIGYKSNNPDYLDAAFVVGNNTIEYDAFDSTSYMQISRSNGIVTMDMPPTRFRNAFSPNDTQWIQATIRVRE